MTNKEIEEFIKRLDTNFSKLYTQVQLIDQKLAQLEFAITNGVPSNPKNRSPADIVKARGNPGGQGGDFL